MKVRICSDPPEHVSEALIIVALDWEPVRGFCKLYSPQYWHDVFMLVYDEAPRDDADPRWDSLFQIGFLTFRGLCKEGLLTED